MAGAPIKFRCNQCGQLLGVSRSRAGSQVSCPKCATTLFVPVTSDSVTTVAPPTKSGTGTASWPAIPPPPGAHGVIDTGVSLDFLDIRPEDIRVEPGAEDLVPHLAMVDTSAPLSEFGGVDPTPPPPLRPEAGPTRTATWPDLPLAGVTTTETTDPPSPPVALAVAPEPVAPGQIPADAPRMLSPEKEVVVPPINLDEPRDSGSRSRRAPAVARPSDLVLPRAVVTAWSLFVLLALAFTFIAGLLAGHFVWRVQ